MTTIEERTRRRITRRLAPFLFALYVLNYMDRVNISYAALQMTGDLHLSNAVFGFGAGLFSSATSCSRSPARCSPKRGVHADSSASA